jgi:uncharacterized protein
MGDLSSEPSMEEILASIKKIIAEDGDKATSSLQARRSSAREGKSPVVLDDLPKALKPVSVEKAEEEDAEMLKDQDDLAAAEAETPETEEVLELTESVAETPAVAEEAPVASPVSLVSNNTEVASRTALASLSALIVKPEVNGSDTLEGMVREMLKPMLKEWLDAKLPDLVEQMVAKEIARISGRGL